MLSPLTALALPPLSDRSLIFDDWPGLEPAAGGMRWFVFVGYRWPIGGGQRFSFSVDIQGREGVSTFLKDSADLNDLVDSRRYSRSLGSI